MRERILVCALLGLALSGPARSGEQVAPGENLVVQGIPPVPSELASELDRYQNVRRARLLDWLPRGRGMLIATRFAETEQVHRVASALGQREQLTFEPDRIAWAVACPSKDSQTLLFGMDQGGTERYQIFRLEPGKEPVQLTPGKGRNMRPVYNRAGTRIAYSSTRRNGADFDIYLMDPARPTEQKLLVEVSGLHLPLDFSPDDKTLLVMHYVSIAESHLYVVDVASGEKKALSPPAEKGVSYRKALFDAKGKRIYLSSDRGWEFVRLGYVEAKSAGTGEFEPKWVTPQVDWDVEDFSLCSDGSLVAYVTNTDGVSELHLATPAGRRQKKSPVLPRGVIQGIQFQRDGRLLAIDIQASRLPGDVFVYDPKKQKVERWTASESGVLDLEALAEPELIHYPTFDQDGAEPRKIPAFVYLPPKDRFKPPYPVLVSIHGGPEGQARPVFLGQANYRIQQMGIALVLPNVRGSAGYGKTYLALDNAKQRENAVRDIGALLDAIASRPDLDAERVAVSGGSYGGYMSLASLISFGARIKAGIDYVGISHFVTFLEHTESYRQDLRRVEYGDERDPDTRIFLDMISPLNNAERIDTPLFVIQGANDPRVPASEAEQIVAKVRERGGAVWYLLAKDEGHGFVKKRNRDFLNLAMVLFLKQHLLR
ncbi:MAG: S9 family peptidase [Deltaproteobacteria bacterium]|nr:S9 family peptidase [Deltaproteobacteria bacterium]